jgi:hypothetical protein
VAQQSIGKAHTRAKGSVSVNAYGVLNGVTFPLAFSLYKPKSRLKAGALYTSKPQLAVEVVQWRWRSSWRRRACASAWCAPTACTGKATTSPTP